jgi:flagellar biosynthesis protein FlhG
MVDAIRKQQVVVDLFPTSKISMAFDVLARTIADEPQHLEPKGSIQFFWKRLHDLGGK